MPIDRFVVVNANDEIFHDNIEAALADIRAWFVMLGKDGTDAEKEDTAKRGLHIRGFSSDMLSFNYAEKPVKPAVTSDDDGLIRMIDGAVVTA